MASAYSFLGGFGLFHSVKIIGEKNHAKVFIDGKEIRGVLSVDFHAAFDELPIVELKFCVDEYEIETIKE